MQRNLAVIVDAVCNGNGGKKLLYPCVQRGGTAWPKESGDQEKYGIRYYYDGEIELNSVIYHKYQMQPNKGKIPVSIENWRDKKGGTHAVTADVHIPKNGGKEDEMEALEKAHKEVEGA